MPHDERITGKVSCTQSKEKWITDMASKLRQDKENVLFKT